MSVNMIQRLVSLSLIVLLVGCSMLPSSDDILPDKKAEYKRSRQAQKNLEVPPDLTKSTINDALVIPDSPNASTATLSGMMEKERVQGRTARHTSVLSKVKGIEVKRDGDQRWLVVQAPAEDVWYTVLDFWQQNGILLIEQDPTVGVMLTDWLENRAAIKSDFITNNVRKVFDGIYSASIQDQYRVRLEAGATPGTTEVYLTHRGMEEKILQANTNQAVAKSVWNPRPTDHGLEAEMLRRLMVFMGVTNEHARNSLAQQQERLPHSQIDRSKNSISLLISDGMDRAWRMTGVALDRVGFAVEDRDRAKGIYFVRYSDPEIKHEKPGFLSKLAFWRDNKKTDSAVQYQIALMSEGNRIRVVVNNDQGGRENSETAGRILTLLHEQLK